MSNLYDFLSRRFDRLQTQIETAVENALDDVAEQSEELIKSTWPSPGDDHPYATGESYRAWKRTKPDRLERLVSNAAARKGRTYARYTNRGFTRWGGEGSAKPYKEKGGQPYVQRHFDRIHEIIREAVSRQLREMR